MRFSSFSWCLKVLVVLRKIPDAPHTTHHPGGVRKTNDRTRSTFSGPDSTTYQPPHALHYRLPAQPRCSRSAPESHSASHEVIPTTYVKGPNAMTNFSGGIWCRASGPEVYPIGQAGIERVGWGEGDVVEVHRLNLSDWFRVDVVIIVLLGNFVWLPDRFRAKCERSPLWEFGGFTGFRGATRQPSFLQE